MTDKNSMLYWYPKIKDLDIPQPKTEFIKVNPESAYHLMDGKNSYDKKKIEEVARRIGYPLFLRTDQMSGKHEWQKTCFVKNEKNLPINIFGVVEATLSCDVIGRPVNAFFFREFIPMDSRYTAFWGNMPISPERRYFIENNKVLCHHSYWIKSAIINPSVENWEDLSDEMNEETTYEIDLLKAYSMMVSAEIEGFWSVDFCKAKDGRWILIDMAMGGNSWHPENCPNNRTEKIDLLEHLKKK